MAVLSVSLPSSPVTGQDDETFHTIPQPMALSALGATAKSHALQELADVVAVSPEIRHSPTSSSSSAPGHRMGLLRMLSLGRAGHSKVNPVEEDAATAALRLTCRNNQQASAGEDTTSVQAESARSSIASSWTTPQQPALRCRIVRKGTLRPQYSCYMDDETNTFLYTARRSLTAVRSWYTFFEDNSLGSRESGAVGQLRANLAGSEYMLFADSSHGGEGQPGSPRSPRSKLKLEAAAQCIVRFGKSFASVGEPGSRSLTVMLPTLTAPAVLPGPLPFPGGATSPPLSRCASSPPLRGKVDEAAADETPAPSLGEVPEHGPDASLSAGLVLESKAPVWSPTKKAYLLDFPKGRVSLASNKNLLLVPRRGALSQGPPPTLLLCGRTGKNTFALDFSPPLSALHAFAIAIAHLDNKLCYAI